MEQGHTEAEAAAAAAAAAARNGHVLMCGHSRTHLPPHTKKRTASSVKRTKFSLQTHAD